MEKTLVIIKPDGIQKNVIGHVISKFENAGLQLVGLKMMTVSETLANKHYLLEEGWYKPLAAKTRAVMEKKGVKMTETDYQIGKRVQTWLKSFLKEGPVVAMVVKGNCAIEIVRKLAGHTEPRQALPGTIRGDLSLDSYSLADKEQRALRNIVHASGNKAEAKREIALWFKKKKL